MDICHKIKERRKQLGLTMLEVAQKIGVSEATVSRWESGNIANMKRDKIAKLAEILEMNPVTFINDVTDTSSDDKHPFPFSNIEEYCSAFTAKTSTTAQRLNYIMKIRNLRQSDILNLIKPYCIRYKVKLGKSALSQYISGKVTPKQDKIFVLGIALDVSEAWLMGYDVPMGRVSSPVESTDNKKTAQTVGKRIKFLRKANAYSQEKLASILNVHQTAISQWETGRTLPDIDLAHKMARLFNVSIDYLLRLEEEKTAQSEPSLSPEKRNLISAVTELSQDQVKKTLEYVEFLKSKQNP